MHSPLSYLEIDLGALDHNRRAFREAAGGAVQLCAVLKQNGYALGAVPIAKRLAANGVDLLAVWSPDEAAELAQAGLAVPVMVLMPVESMERTDVLYRIAVAGRLHLTIHSRRQLRAVERIGRSFGAAIPVHVELDSGMSRGGMSSEEAGTVLRDLADMRYVRLRGVFTHPHSASTDPRATGQQFHDLQEVARHCADWLEPETLVHFANTAAALRERRYHGDMIRIGLGLCGYGQDGMHAGQGAGVAPLRPIVRWMSHLVHRRQVPAGQPVGYDATYRSTRDSVLGLVPIGYADGYPLSLSNRAVVRVGPDRLPAPVRGAVNMDQLIIDLTDLPEADPGESVEIYSNEPDAPNGLFQLADLAGTNIYELLTRLSPRITRRYVTPRHAAGEKHHVATI